MALEIARLDTRTADFETRFQELQSWNAGNDPAVEAAAAEILARVRSTGDRAVLEYTASFDRHQPADMAALRLTTDDLAAAAAALPRTDRQALADAAERIRRYHQHQQGGGFEFEDELGNRLGQRVTPLDSVGVYVPGGQAAYPSTVLMTIVPARVAGVSRIVMVSPTPGGERNPWVLAAAHLAGVTEVYCIGGAQAIGALAYGTETIAPVDKIVGPGGAYVAAAKRQVFGVVGIDVIAGPSEILIVTDGSAPEEWLAFDLFSQAEHDAAAQAIALCPDGAYLDRLAGAMAARLPEQPRRDIIARSLRERGALIHTRDVAEALALSNRVAPEHLELALHEPERWLDQVRHAGAIFLGAHTPEVMGDYVAGPSHVLPTYGTARFSSPLGVYDFQKRSSVIGLSPAGAERLARTSALLARGEGLEAHARAAEARITGLDHNRG